MAVGGAIGIGVCVAISGTVAIGGEVGRGAVGVTAVDVPLSHPNKVNKQRSKSVKDRFMP